MSERPALDALRRFGLARGAWLIGSRLVRCHPWHPGGVDPLPDAFDDAAPSRYLGRVLRDGPRERAAAGADPARDASAAPAPASASPSPRS